MGPGGLGRSPAADSGKCTLPLNRLRALLKTLSRKCSHEENFEWLNRKDDGTQAVKIANPKTLEFQVVRTSLLPGLLKTIRENRSHPLPIRIFEASDVVFKDETRERQARNERHAAAIWCNKTAGFEVVHGMLDRVMKMLEVPRISSTDFKADTGYYIKETSGNLSLSLIFWLLQLILSRCITDPAFFPGRAATIYYRAPPKKSPLNNIKTSIQATFHVRNDAEIGTLGILHPTVLEKFEIGYPCSALEFALEPFKKEMQKTWTDAK